MPDESDPQKTLVPITVLFDYERLVRVIREEMALAVKPLQEGLDRVEEAVDKTYSRELVDEKLRQRDAERDEMKAEIRALKVQVGSFWTNAVVRTGSVLGLVALVIEIFHIHP